MTYHAAALAACFADAKRIGIDGYDALSARAYRWLLERLHPPLWLHGHVPPASVDGWRIEHDGSTVVNVTGAVLVELLPPGIRRPDAG